MTDDGASSDAGLTRKLMIEELEAQNSYEEKARATNDEEAKKVYLDIKREEAVHEGELRELLERQDKNAEEDEEEGEEEVEEHFEASMPTFKSVFESKRMPVIAKSMGVSSFAKGDGEKNMSARDFADRVKGMDIGGEQSEKPSDNSRFTPEQKKADRINNLSAKIRGDKPVGDYIGDDVFAIAEQQRRGSDTNAKEFMTQQNGYQSKDKKYNPATGGILQNDAKLTGHGGNVPEMLHEEGAVPYGEMFGDLATPVQDSASDDGLVITSINGKPRKRYFDDKGHFVKLFDGRIFGQLTAKDFLARTNILEKQLVKVKYDTENDSFYADIVTPVSNIPNEILSAISTSVPKEEYEAILADIKAAKEGHSYRVNGRQDEIFTGQDKATLGRLGLPKENIDATNGFENRKNTDNISDDVSIKDRSRAGMTSTRATGTNIGHDKNNSDVHIHFKIPRDRVNDFVDFSDTETVETEDGGQTLVGNMYLRIPSGRTDVISSNGVNDMDTGNTGHTLFTKSIFPYAMSQSGKDAAFIARMFPHHHELVNQYLEKAYWDIFKNSALYDPNKSDEENRLVMRDHISDIDRGMLPSNSRLKGMDFKGREAPLTGRNLRRMVEIAVLRAEATGSAIDIGAGIGGDFSDSGAKEKLGADIDRGQMSIINQAFVNKYSAPMSENGIDMSIDYNTGGLRFRGSGNISGADFQHMRSMIDMYQERYDAFVKECRDAFMSDPDPVNSENPVVKDMANVRTNAERVNDMSLEMIDEAAHAYSTGMTSAVTTAMKQFWDGVFGQMRGNVENNYRFGGIYANDQIPNNRAELRDDMHVPFKVHYVFTDKNGERYGEDVTLDEKGIDRINLDIQMKMSAKYEQENPKTFIDVGYYIDHAVKKQTEEEANRLGLSAGQLMIQNPEIYYSVQDKVMSDFELMSPEEKSAAIQSAKDEAGVTEGMNDLENTFLEQQRKGMSERQDRIYRSKDQYRKEEDAFNTKRKADRARRALMHKLAGGNGRGYTYDERTFGQIYGDEDGRYPILNDKGRTIGYQDEPIPEAELTEAQLQANQEYDDLVAEGERMSDSVSQAQDSIIGNEQSLRDAKARADKAQQMLTDYENGNQIAMDYNALRSAVYNNMDKNNPTIKLGPNDLNKLTRILEDVARNPNSISGIDLSDKERYKLATFRRAMIRYMRGRSSAGQTNIGTGPLYNVDDIFAAINASLNSTDPLAARKLIASVLEMKKMAKLASNPDGTYAALLKNRDESNRYFARARNVMGRYNGTVYDDPALKYLDGLMSVIENGGGRDEIMAYHPPEMQDNILNTSKGQMTLNPLAVLSEFATRYLLSDEQKKEGYKVRLDDEGAILNPEDYKEIIGKIREAMVQELEDDSNRKVTLGGRTFEDIRPRTFASGIEDAPMWNTFTQEANKNQWQGLYYGNGNYNDDDDFTIVDSDGSLTGDRQAYLDAFDRVTAEKPELSSEEQYLKSIAENYARSYMDMMRNRAIADSYARRDHSKPLDIQSAVVNSKGEPIRYESVAKTMFEALKEINASDGTTPLSKKAERAKQMISAVSEYTKEQNKNFNNYSGEQMMWNQIDPRLGQLYIRISKLKKEGRDALGPVASLIKYNKRFKSQIADYTEYLKEIDKNIGLYDNDPIKQRDMGLEREKYAKRIEKLNAAVADINKRISAHPEYAMAMERIGSIREDIKYLEGQINKIKFEAVNNMSEPERKMYGTFSPLRFESYNVDNGGDETSTGASKYSDNMGGTEDTVGDTILPMKGRRTFEGYTSPYRVYASDIVLPKGEMADKVRSFEKEIMKYDVLMRMCSDNIKTLKKAIEYEKSEPDGVNKQIGTTNNADVMVQFYETRIKAYESDMKQAEQNRSILMKRYNSEIGDELGYNANDLLGDSYHVYQVVKENPYDYMDVLMGPQMKQKERFIDTEAITPEMAMKETVEQRGKGALPAIQGGDVGRSMLNIEQKREDDEADEDERLANVVSNWRAKRSHERYAKRRADIKDRMSSTDDMYKPQQTGGIGEGVVDRTVGLDEKERAKENAKHASRRTSRRLSQHYDWTGDYLYGGHSALLDPADNYYKVPETALGRMQNFVRRDDDISVGGGTKTPEQAHEEYLKVKEQKEKDAEREAYNANLKEIAEERARQERISSVNGKVKDAVAANAAREAGINENKPVKVDAKDKTDTKAVETANALNTDAKAQAETEHKERVKQQQAEAKDRKDKQAEQKKTKEKKTNANEIKSKTELKQIKDEHNAESKQRSKKKTEDKPKEKSGGENITHVGSGESTKKSIPNFRDMFNGRRNEVIKKALGR